MNDDSHQARTSDAYQQALDYLYSLINYEMKRMDRYTASKLDPTRPQQLVEFLGQPQKRFPAIHVAGTKGKGSVAAMCAACLRAAGLKVGLYTSPHVQEFRERIRIVTPQDEDGRIAEADFVELVEEIKVALAHVANVTWFEAVTAIAFLHFARQAVDIAVIEVGLGGRLDPTNVITPLVSVITSLSLDHTQFLGNTLGEIAGEKGGIIKQGVPVVIAPQAPVAMERLLEIAREKEAPVTVVGRDWVYERGKWEVGSGKWGVGSGEWGAGSGERGAGSGKRRGGKGQWLRIVRAPELAFVPQPASFLLALSGAHQLENATVALAALDVAQPAFPGLTPEAVEAGLAHVQWTGRLQIVHQGEGTPTLLVDCAHNPDSAAKLGHALTHDYVYERLWLVLGATADKDVAGIMGELLPLAEMTIATISSHPRAAEPAELARLAAEFGYEIVTSPTIAEALMTAWQLAGAKDLICVTGSIFIVGDLLNQWEGLQSRLFHDYVRT